MSPSRINGNMILLSWNLETQFDADINSRIPDNPSDKINLIIKSSMQELLPRTQTTFSEDDPVPRLNSQLNIFPATHSRFMSR